VATIEPRYFAFGLAVGRALLQVGAFIVRDLARGDADLRLQPTFFPVDAEDNECATGDGGFAVELVDFLAMQQQAANAFGGRDLVAGALVGLDVGVVQESFAFVDAREGVADVRFSARIDLTSLPFSSMPAS
jgi:hypothetical protein